MMKRAIARWLLVVGFGMGALTPTSVPGASGGPQVLAVSEVDRVWSGHPVRFSLITRGDRQFVAYYDANRDMCIAMRSRVAGDTGKWGAWQKTVLTADSPVFGERATPTRIGWDSHNYIALGFDRDGYLHMSGNLHGTPLLYFRSTVPEQPSSLERLDRMTGELEERVTYPRFLTGPTGEMLFAYRDGWSGSGGDVYNVYDTTTRQWRRLLDKPLAEGRNWAPGKTANAYMHGPVLGPDGWYHVVWVWRDTPACETNHSLSYARSRDLVNWEDSSGRALSLPITPATGEVVDPVPIRGGMINGNTLIGFDSEKRVILTYHKFDFDGNTRVFNARREATGWRIVQASRWKFRWNFEGNGSMIFDVHLGPVVPDTGAGGRLRQTWWNRADGDGGTYLDPITLEPTEAYQQPPLYSAELAKSETAGMVVSWVRDGENPLEKETASGRLDTGYVLRWETLPTNRDRPRDGPPPAPTALRVYEFSR